MRLTVCVAAILAGLWSGCDTSDFTSSTPCGGSTCGYLDTQYNSTFYWPPAPLQPGGWYGYTWHDNQHCHDECAAAANWGCDASNCDAVCDQPKGSGAWVECSEANGGTVTGNGCSLAGSGVHGETVPCVCR